MLRRSAVDSSALLLAQPCGAKKRAARADQTLLSDCFVAENKHLQALAALFFKRIEAVFIYR